MSYLIEQILLCLLLAFILGLIIGWLWKRMKASREISRLNGEIETVNRDKTDIESRHEATRQEFESHRLSSQKTIDDLSDQTKQIQPLQNEVTESKSQIASLTSKLGLMESDRKNLEQKYKAETDSLSQKFTAEKDTAVAAVKQEAEKSKKELTALEQQHQQQTASLKAQVSKADSELSRLNKEKQGELEQLKMQLEEQSKTVTDQKAALTQALGNVSKATQDLEELKKQNQKDTASLKGQVNAAKSERKNRELQDREIREKDTAIERLQSQLRAQAALDKEVADAKLNLNKVTSEAKQKDQELVASKNKVSILEQNLKSSQSSKENSSELQKELDSLKKQLTESQSALDSCRQSGQSQQRKITELQSNLDKVQKDRNAISESGRSPTSSENKPNPGNVSTAPAKRTPLFTAPAEKDDLKLIYGIGPVMERILNELGITSFKQISEFSNNDIERVAKAIDTFPDRIERDDWVGGAKMQ